METEAGVALFGQLEQAHSSGLFYMCNNQHHYGSRHLIYMVIQASCRFG